MRTDSTTTVECFLFRLGSRSLLSQLSNESDYWKTVEEFVGGNGDTPLGDLTSKQRQWLFKIERDLINEAGK